MPRAGVAADAEHAEDAGYDGDGRRDRGAATISSRSPGRGGPL
jgi:hypothetical protein